MSDYHLNCVVCHQDYWSHEPSPIRRLCRQCALAVVDRLERSLQRISSENKEEQSAGGIARAALADQSLKIETLDARVADLRTELSTARAAHAIEIDQYRSDLQSAHSQIDLLTSEVAQLKGSIEAFQDEHKADLDKLAKAQDEIERLAWNLAGCTTIAEAEAPQEFNSELATPGLLAVQALAEKYVKLKKDYDRLGDNYSSTAENLAIETTAKAGAIERCEQLQADLVVAKASAERNSADIAEFVGKIESLETELGAARAESDRLRRLLEDSHAALENLRSSAIEAFNTARNRAINVLESISPDLRLP